MSVVEEKEVNVTCKRKKNDPFMSLGGNDEYPPDPDFSDLPRPITTPLEKKKKKITKHIGDDSLKEIVYQMYQGEFVAKLEYTKRDDGTESLNFLFGVSSNAGEDGLIYPLIGNNLEMFPKEDEWEWETAILCMDADFNHRFGTEHVPGFLRRLLHHTLRQHSSSLPRGVVELGLTLLFREYVSMGDSSVELLVDAVVIAADCFSMGQESPVCNTGFCYLTIFLETGIYLESKGRFAAAAAMFEVVCRIHERRGVEPRILANLHGKVGSIHILNQDFKRSEASFIKLLHYCAKFNGNTVNLGDSVTRATLCDLLTVYHDLGVRSHENMVQRSVLAILFMGGFQTTIFSMPNFKRFLKKDYRTPKKARKLFTRAILSGTQSVFDISASRAQRKKERFKFIVLVFRLLSRTLWQPSKPQATSFSKSIPSQLSTLGAPTAKGSK